MCVIFLHITTLKQALNYGLVLKKVHRVTKFNQKTWLRPCIDMNIKLRPEAKYDFEEDFFKLIKNTVFGKTKLSYNTMVFEKSIRNRNEQNKSKSE